MSEPVAVNTKEEVLLLLPKLGWNAKIRDPSRGVLWKGLFVDYGPVTLLDDCYRIHLPTAPLPEGTILYPADATQVEALLGAWETGGLKGIAAACDELEIPVDFLLWKDRKPSSWTAFSELVGTIPENHLT